MKKKFDFNREQFHTSLYCYTVRIRDSVIEEEFFQWECNFEGIAIQFALGCWDDLLLSKILPNNLP